ncbi:hypothetical protein YC2023_002098 [Brassica napus]
MHVKSTDLYIPCKVNNVLYSDSQQPSGLKWLKRTRGILSPCQMRLTFGSTLIKFFAFTSLYKQMKRRRLASLLLPPQQPLQKPNALYASNLDQNLQTPNTSVSSQDSQPQAECTTPAKDETSYFEPIMNARLEVGPSDVLPPLSESFDLDSLMSTPNYSPQQNNIEAEANSSSLFDFRFPDNFTFDDFMGLL